MLKTNQIADLLEKDPQKEDDPLIITPKPDISELKISGSASIDLRLGTWFVSLRQARMGLLKIEEKEQQPRFTKTSYVRYGESFYLHPRSFVLGITLEWIRIPNNIGCYVIGKSSLGRRGLIIATAAGVHPGFTGCLTLELSNVGEIPIEITPGMRICQLFMHNIEKPGREIDKSGFIGHRKPLIGKLELDPIARKLKDSK